MRIPFDPFIKLSLFYYYYLRRLVLNRLGLQTSGQLARSHLLVIRLGSGLILMLLLVCALFFHFSSAVAVVGETPPAADAFASADVGLLHT